MSIPYQSSVLSSSVSIVLLLYVVGKFVEFQFAAPKDIAVVAMKILVYLHNIELNSVYKKLLSSKKNNELFVHILKHFAV